MAASRLPEAIDNIYLFIQPVPHKKDNKDRCAVTLAMVTLRVQKLDHHCIFPMVGTNSCRQS